MKPLTDYYVGLLRGYLLAHNAPQQILHALEELLTHYRSKAGPLIGEDEAMREAAHQMAAENFAERIIELQHSPSTPIHKEPEITPPTGFFWTPKQLQDLKDNYATMKMRELKVLIGRSPQSIYNKALVLGLKKTEKAEELA